MTSASAQARIRPVAVRVAVRIRTPTTASFKMELRLPRQSCAAPRCSPTAAPSRVIPAMVATDPTTNNVDMTGSAPMIRRLFPSQGESAIVPIDMTSTANAADRVAGRVESPLLAGLDPLDLGDEQQGDPEGTERGEGQRGRCRRRGDPDVLGIEEMCRHCPVGEADDRRRTLPGDEEPERREEAPYLVEVFRFRHTEPFPRADPVVVLRQRAPGPDAWPLPGLRHRGRRRRISAFHG